MQPQHSLSIQYKPVSKQLSLQKAVCLEANYLTIV